MSVNQKIMTPTEICSKFGWSKTTQWRRVKIDQFPAAIDLGGSQRVWLENEVAEWLASRPRASAHVQVV